MSIAFSDDGDLYLAAPDRGALVPNRYEDWPALVDRIVNGRQRVAQLRAEVGDTRNPDADLLARIEVHNGSVGPFQTRDIAAISDKLNQTVRFNQGNGAGRMWLGVNSDGRGAGSGKSESIVTVGGVRMHQTWTRHGRTYSDGSTTCERIPFAYVLLNGTMGTRALMRATMDFFAYPWRKSDTATELMRPLQNALRAHGTTVIVYDDAHELRTQPGQKDFADFSNFLKSMVSGLSATLVFVGNGLQDTALLSATTDREAKAVEQLRVRMRQHTVANYGTSKRDIEAVRGVLRELENNLVLPRRDLTGTLTGDETIKNLIGLAHGRLGRITVFVKTAASTALRTGADLSWPLIERVVKENLMDWEAPAVENAPDGAASGPAKRRTAASGSRS